MEIQEVAIREFSRYFSRYKGSHIDVTNRGDVVGHYRPVGHKNVGQAPKSDMLSDKDIGDAVKEFNDSSRERKAAHDDMLSDKSGKISLEEIKRQSDALKRIESDRRQLS